MKFRDFNFSTSTSEAIEHNPENPDDPMITGHLGINPAKLSYRIKQAKWMLAELAKRAQTAGPDEWRVIAHHMKELEINIEQIRHAYEEMGKKYFGEGKDLNNFTVDDIRELELIRDLNVLKQQAIALISKPSKRPMDPEKVQWFRSKIDSLQRPTQVIKLMYDLLLSGEGNAVIGDRYSTKKNNYRQTFGESIDEDWQKVNKHDKTSGMSKKAVKAYRRENPGSKLKTAVTTKPSKLKKGSKSAKRRKSFCARMSGMKKSRASAKTKRDPNSPINKALRRWNCESIEEMRNMIVYATQELMVLKEAANPAQQAAIAVNMKKHHKKPKNMDEDQRLDPKCWKGYRKQGTKMKGNTRVNNCVKVGENWENKIYKLIKILESK